MTGPHERNSCKVCGAENHYRWAEGQERRCFKAYEIAIQHGSRIRAAADILRDEDIHDDIARMDALAVLDGAEYDAGKILEDDVRRGENREVTDANTTDG